MMDVIGKECADGHSFVLKNVPDKTHFDYSMDLYCKLDGSRHLRALHDTVPSDSVLVFPFLRDDLLKFACNDLSTACVKAVLNQGLHGIAELHARGIVHPGVKPSNFFLDYHEADGKLALDKVQLSDLEDARMLMPSEAVSGTLTGNELWRSPEAWAKGPLALPSDMFSFWLVCLYVVLRRIVLAYTMEELEMDEEKLRPEVIILHRQIFYFAEESSFAAFLEYLGDSPYRQIFEVLLGGFDDDSRREPVRLWSFVKDEDVKDLVAGLTDFDPRKRLTTDEALKHRRFTALNDDESHVDGDYFNGV
ncbi:hypothetical protein LTR78_000358 [Recurvomyces mirabilis]|uniref:Protein kinase domain-containing protein n=1 Tax=Recurvomyces mirabilis TaxID=574656 RepID=A0AAE0WXZ0_9PEZI|nr:hypothetical protein LTR78_000358 [Recurvomyces mirabilis]KAK5162013.1 hypothetical protein LTS14_000359 [Recurvomyces mirabilis]